MKKYEFCHQFTFDVAVQLYGVMQYLFDSSLWRGTGGIVFQFSLGGSFTMTAVVGPVPVFAGGGRNRLGEDRRAARHDLQEPFFDRGLELRLHADPSFPARSPSSSRFLPASGSQAWRLSDCGGRAIFRITWVSRRRTRIARCRTMWSQVAFRSTLSCSSSSSSGLGSSGALTTRACTTRGRTIPKGSKLLARR